MKMNVPFAELTPEESRDLDAALALRESRGEKFSRLLVREAERLANVMAGCHPDMPTAKINRDSRVRYLKEAMTSADFGSMFTTALDRELLPKFTNAPRVMGRVFRESPLNDFRSVERFRGEGGQALLPVIAPAGPYLTDKLDVTPFTYKLAKFGKQVAITAETIINDDLGFFDRLPADLANSAVLTEEFEQTKLFFGASGPLAGVFAGQGGQAAVSILPLTATNLKVALGQMLEYLTPVNGNPLAIRPAYLMVPPALEMTAFEILRSVTFMPGGNDATGTRFATYNAFQNLNIQVLTNPWMTILGTGGGPPTYGQTSWALFTAPSTIAAGEWGFLRGYREPQILLKENVRLLRGGLDPFGGDYDNDVRSMKVRHFGGGTALEGRAVWGSKGQA